MTLPYKYNQETQCFSKTNIQFTKDDAVKYMKSILLPIYKEADTLYLAINKELDNKYYKKLASMALCSQLIRDLNDHLVENQKRFNISRMDLSNRRWYVSSDGNLYKKDGLMFGSHYRELNKTLTDFNILVDYCEVEPFLATYKDDVGEGIHNYESRITPDGKIIDWNKAKKSDVFAWILEDNILEITHKTHLKISERPNNDTYGYKANGVCREKAEKIVQGMIDAFCDSRRNSNSSDIQVMSSEKRQKSNY